MFLNPNRDRELKVLESLLAISLRNFLAEARKIHHTPLPLYYDWVRKGETGIMTLCLSHVVIHIQFNFD
jgi:hypothetical protein